MSGMFSSLRSTILTLAFLAGAAPFSPVRSDDPRARSYALLVGVRDYDSSRFNPLKYTENDVEELGQLLAGQPGFSVVRLTTARGKVKKSDAPTRQNIQNALNALLALPSTD